MQSIFVVPYLKNNLKLKPRSEHLPFLKISAVLCWWAAGGKKDFFFQWDSDRNFCEVWIKRKCVNPSMRLIFVSVLLYHLVGMASTLVSLANESNLVVDAAYKRWGSLSELSWIPSGTPFFTCLFGRIIIPVYFKSLSFIMLEIIELL